MTLVGLGGKARRDSAAGPGPVERLPQFLRQRVLRGQRSRAKALGRPAIVAPLPRAVDQSDGERPNPGTDPRWKSRRFVGRPPVARASEILSASATSATVAFANAVSSIGGARSSERAASATS